MALKIPTVMTYPLTGAVDFAITFEYLARKFVTVTLIGKDRKELVLNQDYRFTTKTQITTTRPWTASDGYQMIEIRRFTSATERLVDFADGSILRAYDLNIAQIQTLHVAEEARDLTADTIGVNNDGHLDARGRRIVNVADGIEPGDAITLGQVTRWNESALNSKNAAKVSETNSKDSENKAKASETNAKNSENLAHDWAQKSEDSPVTGSEYSAYHYSRKASASANASASSAAASLASQNAAKVSEDTAKVSETNAKASEVSAKADADRAEREADKLGNINDFAGTIKSVNVETNHITFKGTLETDGGITAHGASAVNSLTVSRDAVVAGASWLHETNVDGDLSVTRNVIANGDVTSYARAPANPSSGAYLNTAAIRAKLIGRGGLNNPDGAYCGFYLQEQVGVAHRIILNLNGFGQDNNWLFHAGGKIGTPYGEVQTAGSDIRIKTEVDPAPEGAGERIDGIGLVEYTEIGTGRRRRGWIAQQVEAVDPMYAYLSEDLLNTDDRAMLADLIATVQDLRQRVAELEADKE